VHINSITILPNDLRIDNDEHVDRRSVVVESRV